MEQVIFDNPPMSQPCPKTPFPPIEWWLIDTVGLTSFVPGGTTSAIE
ncbi:hypothetical protein SAMN05216327_110100 [Dyadobacter sp. SG02]|nr:hypothetical protein SAMN05216327_110100 [Dyadobacter sp. SG02]